MEGQTAQGPAGLVPRLLQLCESLSAGSRSGRKDQPARTWWVGELFINPFLFLLITLFISTLFDFVPLSYLHFRRKESMLTYSQTKLALFSLKAFWGCFLHRGNQVDLSQGYRHLLTPWDQLKIMVAAGQDDPRPHNATRSSHRYLPCTQVPKRLLGQSWMPVWTAPRSSFYSSGQADIAQRAPGYSGNTI